MLPVVKHGLRTKWVGLFQGQHKDTENFLFPLDCWKSWAWKHKAGSLGSVLTLALPVLAVLIKLLCGILGWWCQNFLMPGGHVLGDKSPGGTGRHLTTDSICVIWKVHSSRNRYQK